MKPQILFLHGAGTSNKNTVGYLRKLLAGRNVQSYTFNFSGHSGKGISKSSLGCRIKEAEAAIKSFNLKEPLNLCGSSMGSYIAIKLLEQYRVKNLILFAPAVYDVRALDTSFNTKFSKIIREKDSWKNSDAVKILQKFSGNAMIFIGENDEVIPGELIKLLGASLSKAKSKEIRYIPNCPHKIHGWLKQDKKWRNIVSRKIAALVLGILN